MDLSLVKVNLDNQDDINGFYELAEKLYDNIQIKNYQMRLKPLLQKSDDYSLYIVKKNNSVVGRFVVGINKDIIDTNDKPFGYIGFLETIDDFYVFSKIFDFAKFHLKEKVSSILYPFFKSTWYDYRLEVPNDTFNFFMEPPVKDYYHDFINRYGYNESHLYYSSIRKNLSNYLKALESSFNDATEKGFTFRNIDKAKIKEELQILYDISIKSFNKNPFYSEISFESFYSLYSKIMDIVDTETLTFALKDNKEVGFMFSMLDYSEIFSKVDLSSKNYIEQFFALVSNINGLIHKTVAILPEFRGNKLIGALCYLHAQISLKRNYSYIISAYLHADNLSMKTANKAKDDVLDKSYKLYQIDNKN
ncbi:MAG: hypothetical protein HQK76_16980 [Desulfobacterales bacterium]|nr:hypothetical protein [Desulfobacterales bacterium]